jgi:hypothetical protein
LEKFDDGAGRIVRGAIEGHVFEEVGEAALVIGLVERTGEDDEAEAGAFLGLVVGEDDVMQAVGEFAEAGSGVRFQIAAFVSEAGRLGRRGGEERGGEREGCEESEGEATHRKE